jgi:hypothetical protein
VVAGRAVVGVAKQSPTTTADYFKFLALGCHVRVVAADTGGGVHDVGTSTQRRCWLFFLFLLVLVGQPTTTTTAGCTV